VRRPDPLVLERLHTATARRPPEAGWPSEPWDLDAFPDCPDWPSSLEDWPARATPSASRRPPAVERPDAAPPLSASAAGSPAPPDQAGWAPPPGPRGEHVRSALAVLLPTPLREGSWDAGRQGALAIGVLGLLAAVAALAFALHGRAHEVAAPVVPAVASVADPISGGVSVEVDVEGKVRRPGLVSLPSGSRVAAALVAAGGALPGADTSALDLAAQVTDGQQLVVGLTVAPGGAASTTAGSTPGSPPGSTLGSTLLDLNTATAEQLDALPQVGPATAAEIISWRTAHGPFTAVSELQQIAGIGPSTYQDIAPLVTV
jgi:competence protein ComEA